MRIDRVETYLLRRPLPEPRGFSQYWSSRRETLLVKVTGDDGTAGWGEAAGEPTVARAMIESFIAPRLAGRDPLHAELIWDELYTRARDFGRAGSPIAALGAVDIALWDLAARGLGVPLHDLLGGARTTSFEICGAGLFLPRGERPSERIGAEAERLRDLGCRALKLKVGFGKTTDLANLRAVRRAVGPDVRVAIDADHAFTAARAIELGLHAAVEQVAWFEDPVAPEDLAGCREVRTALAAHGVPIAGGATTATAYGFRDLFAARCVDLAQPDPTACGGITAARRILALAQAEQIEARPTAAGSVVALAAAMQLAAVAPEAPGALQPPARLIDWLGPEDPLQNGLAGNFPLIEHGRVTLPNGPGLGIEVDEAALAEL